ncbi:hypothetical protein HK096_001688, partial [Nowakowskiella sp. JEL0078]
MIGDNNEVVQLQTRLDQALADLQRAQLKSSSHEWLAVRAELDRLRSRLDSGPTTLSPTVVADAVLEDDFAGASAAANAGWPKSDSDYLYDFYISYSPGSVTDARLALELYFRLQLFEVPLPVDPLIPENVLATPEYTIPFKKRVFLDSETLGNTE